MSIYQVELESTAATVSIRYSAAVSRISPSARALAAFGLVSCAACAGVGPHPDEAVAAPIFYTLTGEIALSRHEPRVAALEYVAATDMRHDTALLQRAVAVTAQCLQPSLTRVVTQRWLALEPRALEAQRAAGLAALDLDQIDAAAAHYGEVLRYSPDGADAEFTRLESQLSAADESFEARQLADRLARHYPGSMAALRFKAVMALRAADPDAAVSAFQAALNVAGGATADERRELTEGLWRARILSGAAAAPLAEARARLEREGTVQNRFDYAMLLLAAQDDAAAREQLRRIGGGAAAAPPDEYSPAAARLLALLDYQEGDLDDAGARFTELAAAGQFLDDDAFYLGLIAERHADLERALSFYFQVQGGENAVAALLRAATILHSHGAAPAADELLDRLVEEVPLRAPEILAARARIDADDGDAARASEVLAHARLQYPDNVELRYAAASLADERGDVDTALRELNALVRQRPDDPAALNAYGYTLADHGRQLALARKLIDRAYAAAPKNAAILDSLGWVSFRQGNSAQALTYLNEAYMEDRGGDIAAHLGEVLWLSGRQADAERIWSEAMSVDGQNRLIKETRTRLHAST